MNTPSTMRNAGQGFSLVELLAVMAIIVIMAAFIVPSVGSIRQAAVINQGGQLVSDQLIYANQEAAQRNRDVELRIINIASTGGPEEYRALQLWSVAPDGVTPVPIGKVESLPEGATIAFDQQLSPLLDADPTVPPNATLTGGVFAGKSYKRFRFRASGDPPTSLNATNNFLTVQSVNATSVPPANFFTVRVNPATGRVSIYRP